MKIKGLKKAIGEYQKSNTGDFYGRLMFDTSTGEIWCDVFCDYTHQTKKVYHSPAIVDILELMNDAYYGEDFVVNMRTVKDFIIKKYPKFAE